MNQTAMVTDTPRSPAATGAPVWDRLWQHHHTDAKDDVVLERERRARRWSMISDRLRATFGRLENLRTIELGSGRGDLSTLLAESGAKVTLLDSSDRALDQARHRFDRLGLDGTFERADMFEYAGAHAGEFDVALSSGVIEHFKGAARTKVIRAHRDVLQPVGVTVISVPHARCIPYRVWKLYLELRGWWPYGMEIPYSARELRRRAHEAGFVSTEAHCMGFLQSVGVHWAQRLVGRRPGWTDKPSRLDSTMGFTLLMFGWCR